MKNKIKQYSQNRLLGGFAAAAALLALGGTASAQTTTITTADGVGADGEIWRQNGDENAGARETMRTENGGNDWSFLIRFDTSTITGPVTSADITLTLGGLDTANLDSIRLYGLDDGSTSGAGEDYDEGVQDRATSTNPDALTWDNAPGRQGFGSMPTQSGFDSEMTLLDTQNMQSTFTQGDTITWSSQALVDHINDDTTGRVVYGFSTGSAFGGTAFFTKENTSGFDAPTLTTVPEPRAYALVGGALAFALVLLRRRRG